MINGRPNTIAIVVTYSPHRATLERLLGAITPQVDGVIVIDNHTPESHAVWLQRLLEQQSVLKFLRLSANLGVAAAHNIGIECARTCGARFVILFDQDSEPAADMVARLHEALDFAEGLGHRVAAVGPNYIDERHNNPPPFIRISGLRLVRARSNNGDAIVPVDYLISSGCLIPLDVLDVVGGMREELFIDYVDIEWGLRAKRHGFQAIGSLHAKMRHKLGENPLIWRGRAIPTHTALRHYYHFRNAAWLYRQPWVPLNWKLVDGYRLVLKFGFYSMYARPQLRHLRMMMLGLWHGFRGRMHQLH